ncbi:substrate-binding domain-containing protein [bacterium]|nr:substrate-binding domain-containing protein [bacterium]
MDLSRFLSSQSRQKMVAIALFIVLLFVVLSLAGYILLIPGLKTLAALEGASFSLARILLLAGILGVFLIVPGGFLLNRIAVSKPKQDLIRAGKSLVKKDLASLTTAMTELATGNLSPKVSMQTKTVPVHGEKDTQPIIEIFNSITENLQKVSAEFNIVTEKPCLRMCYVGADSFLEGQKCGEVMAKAIGGKGQVVVSTGSLLASGLELRRKGFTFFLRNKYPEISIVEIFENRESHQQAYQNAKEVIQKYPHLAGIYVTEGATPAGAARAVVETNNQGRIKIVCHDMTDDTMMYLKRGVITATLGQDPFAQGHDPVIHLYNYLTAGWKPAMPRMLTNMDVVTLENANQYWLEGRGMVQTQASLNRLAHPLNNTNEKPLKLAVIGREDSAFWYPVRDGALKAAEELKPLHVQADWIVPEETARNRDLSAKVMGKTMQTLIEEGYQGIACIPVDREMVDFINDAVRRGIPVITLNSEPFSLRSLVYTLTDQATRLMGLSETIATSTYEVSVATNQVKKAMNTMSEGSVYQSNQIQQTKETVDFLLSNIDKVSQEADESAKAGESTSQAVGMGVKAMEQMLATMKTLEKSVTDTWQIVEELGKHSDRIDGVVDLIKDIASRVNVLALNAAIEATRAGESGKGFMVVAKEVRQLAKNTGDATQEVNTLVGTVKTDIVKVEKVMNEGLGKISQSADLTNQAGQALKRISDFVKVDQERLRNIAEAMQRMQQFSHDVGLAMDRVASVSSKNTQTVEEVNTATNEMSDQLENVASLSKDLEEMAKGEQDLMAKFTLETD